MELLNQELLEQDKGTQELLRQVLEGTKIFHFLLLSAKTSGSYAGKNQ